MHEVCFWHGQEGMNPVMKFAVLDFETTGAQPHDQIIQVGLVFIEQGKIANTYASYVNPGIPIPEMITQLTGIADDTVKDAPMLEQVVAEFQPLLEDCVLVAHQASFDASFLQRALTICGYDLFGGRVLDTMDFLRMLYPGLPSLQLNSVCRSLEVSHERQHQADCDAEATAQVWLKCVERLEDLPLLTIQRLCHLFDGMENIALDFTWFLHHIRERKELQTSIDLHADRYFRQFTVRVGDWTEEQPAREEAGAAVVSPDSSFAQFYSELKPRLQSQFAQFEDRAAQEQMIQEVFQAFDDERHLMIEAGTGTGKSLGYLIPALYYGILHEKKVLVSTHTINLQEQIRERDIPLLQNIFPFDFRASVLKGRNHYLCMRKFEQKINLADFQNVKEDRMTAAQMIVWLGETEHGDNEEIHLSPKGTDFWHTVESDTESCLNRACPWFKKCFYHRAKHEANISDVIITNHSLLLTDVKADNRLLPAYDHLVIDEAHHFEQVASKHLGLEVSYFSMVNALTWVYKDSRTGLLPLLRFRLQDIGSEKAEAWCAKIDGLFPKLLKVKEEWEHLTEQLFAMLAENEMSRSEVGQYLYRMKEETLPASWEQFQVSEDNIYVELTDVLKQAERLIVDLKDEDEDEYNVQAVLTDLSGAIKELYRHRDALRFIMRMTDQGYVYWLEAGQHYRSKSVQFMAVPIDISPLLQKYFFDQKESVVLTSATLSVDKTFQFSCDQLGLMPSLDSGKLKTLQLPSPFNYREQALVCIPRDFPSVRGGNDSLYIERLCESLKEVAIATKGRMLVLFTSYRMLKQVHESLKVELKPHGIQVLGQGLDSGSRSKLIGLFQSSSASILLGTSSFWEGVDIPGDALTCLAIVRLPFQPPNHPLVEAKCEELKKQNKNPFMKFSVPQAVIRFKQGFGRLVRTASDRGIVVVYDTRVIDTFYGKYFLYSLPGPKIEHMPSRQLVPRIEEWLNQKVQG